MVNLYGPTLVHERGKGGDLLKQIKTSDTGLTGIELVDLLDVPSKREEEEEPKDNETSNSENTFVRKITSSFERRSNNKELLHKSERGNKIAHLQHKCRGKARHAC